MGHSITTSFGDHYLLLIRSLYRRCFKVLFRPNDLEAEAEIFGRSVRLAG